jgi:hypothetical protein
MKKIWYCLSRDGIGHFGGYVLAINKTQAAEVFYRVHGCRVTSVKYEGVYHGN